MSIGSQTDGGARAIYVSDLTIDGSDNGLRIKSNPTRGGEVRDVTYENVCIRNTDNPVVMDSSYSAHVSNTSNRLPSFRDITVRNVSVQGRGDVSLEGLDETHRLGIAFDNVVFDDPASIKVSGSHADVKVGPGPFNLKVEGKQVVVTGTAGKATPYNCEGRFVAFPTVD
jgi:polygalacturonase